jgi:hypothetical protein
MAVPPTPMHSTLTPEEINERYEKLMKLAADNVIVLFLISITENGPTTPLTVICRKSMWQTVGISGSLTIFTTCRYFVKATL